MTKSKPAFKRVAQEQRGNNLRRAVMKAKLIAEDSAPKPYYFPIKAPELFPGIVPKDTVAPVLAMDYAGAAYQFAGYGIDCVGFPGYSYLSMLAARAEYRAFASTLSSEITREWIEFTSAEDDGDETADKIKEIEAEFKRLNIRSVVQKAAEHDCYFGRGQIFIDIKGADRTTPLIIDPRTIKQGSLQRVVPVEAIWTTPNAYNALDPSAPDFYRPSGWFMLGQQVHSTRMLTIITRPLPDILRPAFNFGGISLSQLAEPYVDNWLRTRQSVSDLINNFSITVLATDMSQILQGGTDGTDLFDRAALFTATRSNRGLMMLDKEREELTQLNAPLSGLDQLQAQSQEHMSTVSKIPLVILTGISPSGLNASSEGEIRVFYDWILSQQEAYWRDPIEIMLKVVQLHLFGEIDQRIGFNFVPLFQLTGKEQAEIRTADGTTDSNYIDRGVLSAEEVRERLAKDPLSGYHGLDTSIVPIPPIAPDENEKPPGEEDDSDIAKDHIVEESGKFRLLSHEGKNLGTFDSRAEAEKHEKQVNYFKAQ